MSTPLGGGHIIFAFSAVRRHTLFPVISRKSIYPIFTKFGMGVYWVNSLHGVTLCFRSFQGKIFILSLPNLVWVFIGLIACMGLLLVKIAL